MLRTKAPFLTLLGLLACDAAPPSAPVQPLLLEGPGAAEAPSRPSAPDADAPQPLAPSVSAVATLPASAAPPAPTAPPPPLEPPGAFARTFEAHRFYKGNLHTHTLESDGDTKPSAVITWYREHGYAFLALTDHDQRLEPRKFRTHERADFLLLAGEELSMAGGQPSVPVHVNALCHPETIGGGRFPTVTEALTHGVFAVNARGGLALVNHPNFDWALRPADLEAARGAALLEVWSGHPFTHPEGDAQHPSAEAFWDEALERGLDFAPAAVDDSHHFAPDAPEPRAAPGRGWVQVAARALSERELCKALSEGKLYASTGPVLERLEVRGGTFSLTPRSAGARVEFVGRGGKVLAEATVGSASMQASYALRGGEAWVRARVTDPDGTRAWTPAFRVRKGS